MARVSPESLASHAHLAGRRTLSSEPLGWSFPLVELVEQPQDAEPFTIPAAPDLVMVMCLRGRRRIESRVSARWQAAVYQAGTIGLTAPGVTDTLRWGTLDATRCTTLHVHIPHDVVESTRLAMEVGARVEDLNVLDLHSPPVEALLHALHVAVRHEAQPLVGECIAQALTAQLLATVASTTPTRRAVRSPELTPRTLDSVLQYMHANVQRSITLDELAQQAYLSKFHFLRAFTATVGSTPHRYLTEIRMQRAAELLTRGDRTVAAVAALCGYSSAQHFSAVFRRSHGVTPGDVRRKRR